MNFFKKKEIEKYRDIFFKKDGNPVLNKVLERNVFKPLEEHDPEVKYSKNRFLDLILVLKIFYKIEHRNPGLYFSDKKESDNSHPLDSFRIYVANVVVPNFPFKEFKIGNEFKSDNPTVLPIISAGEYAVEPEKWDIWIDELIVTSNRRASWKPVSEYALMDFRELIYTRACRLFDLACVLEELYNIHVLDTEKKYGTKLIMCGYIGQYIVRQYPFKDYAFFSKKFIDKKSSIYEHWTPMAHFAKIIVFPEERLKEYNIDLGRKGWFEMLYYFYRTVYIHKEKEDRMLNKTDKTFRKRNAYENIHGEPIEIVNSMDSLSAKTHPDLFDKMHDLDLFYSLFTVDQTGINKL